MTRAVPFALAFAALPAAAMAQEVPEIPAPTRAAQQAYFVSSADDAANRLPTGRRQTQGQAPTERNSGYAGERPAAYTRPAGQQVYTSKAYPGPVSVPAPTMPNANAMEKPSRTASARRAIRGLRAEVRVGWDQLGTDGTNGDVTADGIMYGLGVGYDREWGNMFVGGYASIDWSDATTDQDVLIAGTPANTELAISSEATQDIEIGIRLGYWLGEQWNVYGFAGLSQLSLDVTSTATEVTPADPGTPGSVETRTDMGTVMTSIDQDGWRVGAGSEYVLPHGFYTKAEYRYSSYGDDPAVAGQDLDRHQLMTGVGIRF